MINAEFRLPLQQELGVDQLNGGVARVLLISGSTRSASTNSALVRTAALCTPPGVEAVALDTVLDGGLNALPHFNPDLDVEPLPGPVAMLRAAIAAADAVLFFTPEYAGTLPGSFKNLLDWTVGGTALTEKPVAWINVTADPRRGGGASATLATVLGYVQAAVVDEACVHIPIDRTDVEDGVVSRADTRALITAALTDLVAAARS